MSNTFVLLIFGLLLLSSYSEAQDVYAYSKPRELNDGWRTDDLRNLGVDTSGIYQLFNELRKEEHKIHSVLIVQNNRLVLEEYFDGQSIDIPHDLRSVSKSIRSILMGIAIDQGLISHIDDPISKYLKHPIPNQNLDERKNDITIKHLLTMSTGLDCNDWDKKSKGQEDKVYKKKDWLQYTLDLPMLHDPGTVSNYCSMGVTLATEVVSQASGMTIDQFADKYIFRPMEITNVSWGHTSDQAVIPSGKRLYMTSRDMAKIGQLVLNQGQWNGQPIVSQQWIDEATTPKVKITGMEYGYLWWNIPFQFGEEKLIAKVATGNGGQYIMVFPALDLVAIFTGKAYNSSEDKLPFTMMNRVILPALHNP